MSSAPPRGSIAMTTFVYIHGAGDSGAAFDLVATRLRTRGHAVVDAIGDRDEIVVVAHSLGGLTAPLVADRVGADLLVLLSAMVPAPGETGNEWWAGNGHADAYRAHNAGRGESDDEIYFHDLP